MQHYLDFTDKKVEAGIGNKQKKKTTTKTRRPHAWKNEVAKQARQSGQAYMSRSGKMVLEKKPNLQVLCTKKCRLNCSQIPLDKRKEIFNSYYSLKTEDLKTSFLFGCIEKSLPKRVVVGSERNREFVFKYYINVNEEKMQVCKQALCELLQIGRGKVAYIQNQHKEGAVCGKISYKGRHKNRPRTISDAQLSFVKDHIKSFPSESSHYSRHHNPHRKYLSPLLNISKLYNLYCIKCEDVNMTPVSVTKYSEIFKKEFNLGFGSPKTDTCSKCDVISNPGTENNLRLEEHKARAKLAFDAQKIDKDRACQGECVMITFDLQQAMPLPKLSTSIAFYKRQVWLYNLGVHLISQNQDKPYFHIWTENEAGRGADEVGSALLQFLDKSEIHGGRLVMWSDSCSGQNKNFFIVALCQFLVANKVFEIVDHKFPEPGHSYMESDRDFGRIEKIMRKHQNIYDVDTYHHIMYESNKKKTPVITRMANCQKDIKSLPKMMNLVQRTVNMQGEPVNFRDSVRWIRTEKYGEYKYRHSVSESEDWKVVQVVQAKGKSCSEINWNSLKSKVPQNKSISAEKYRNIQEQLAYIPHSMQGFYSSLQTGEVRQETEGDADSDEDNRPTAEAQDSDTDSEDDTPLSSLVRASGKQSKRHKHSIPSQIEVSDGENSFSDTRVAHGKKHKHNQQKKTKYQEETVRKTVGNTTPVALKTRSRKREASPVPVSTAVRAKTPRSVQLETKRRIVTRSVTGKTKPKKF